MRALERPPRARARRLAEGFDFALPFLLTTSAFHNIHHSHAVVHFGEAMTIWDRICKTRLYDQS